MNESVTILGDWFYAESITPTPGAGYRQTLFTTHAPSMQAKIDLFDQEFSELLNSSGWRPEESRIRAIEKLKEVVSEIDAVLAAKQLE